MKIIKDFIYRWRYELFALAGDDCRHVAASLLPGYILTLDLVFGPSHVFYWPTGFLNTLPITVLLYGLAYLIPAWLVEKALLAGIIFSLFYLTLRFFPEELECPEWAKYLAAVIYAVNPFVYERVLGRAVGSARRLCAFGAALLYALALAARAPHQACAMACGCAFDHRIVLDPCARDVGLAGRSRYRPCRIETHLAR